MAPSATSTTVTLDEQPATTLKNGTTTHATGPDELESQLSEMSVGPNALSGIPTFSSFEEHRKHICLHMAAAFRNWARMGFTEGTSGHISVRDPEHEDCFWMNPIGKHFGLLTAGDMLCIQMDTGRIVGGNNTRPYNKPGFYIHSEVHKARPDVHSICHAHTIAGRAWCAFGKPLDMIHQDICDFYTVLALDNEYAGIVTASGEGEQIAKALGPRSKAALLLNHGLITVGATVDEASFLFGLLDRSCEIQLRVEAACAGNPGLEKRIIPHELAMNNYKMAGEKNWLYEEAQPDIEYEIEMAGEKIRAGIENVEIDRL